MHSCINIFTAMVKSFFPQTIVVAVNKLFMSKTKEDKFFLMYMKMHADFMLYGSLRMFYENCGGNKTENCIK